MRFRLGLAAAALIGAFAFPTIAAAQSLAYSVPGRTNMRAAPGVDFPIVAQVVGGSAVEVYGCLSDYSWCDTSVQEVRGWIAASRLEFEYAGGLLPFSSYYSYFDVPVVGFSFGYWDDYYRDRPFYRDSHWQRDRERDRERGPVSREIPIGDGFEPPVSGGPFRPYSESPRDGYNQPQMGAGAGPGGDGVAPHWKGGNSEPGGPPTEIVPHAGSDGGLPCPPGKPVCR